MTKKMKILISISLILLAIPTIKIFGFIENSKEILENTTFNNEHQTVVFLNKENSSTYLTDSEYFNHINDYFDTSIRLEKDFSNENPNENKILLKNHTLEQTLNWETKEIDRVYDIIQKTQAEISLKTTKVLQDTLYLIKTTGKENFDAYYTAKKAIVIPKTELKFLWIAPRKKEVQGTYAHEYLHILTRQDTLLRDELYNIIGFQKVKNFIISDSLNNLRITNPDVLALDYAIKLKDASGKENSYTLLLVSKYAKYNGKKGFKGYLNTLLGYAEVNLYKVSPEGKVSMYKKEFNDEFLEKIGTLSNYRYGPDEIIAEGFEVLINGNEEERSKLSERNKAILNDIESILSE